MIMTPGQLETQMLKLKEEAKDEPVFSCEQALYMICEIMRAYGYDSAIDIFEDIYNGKVK